MKRNLSPLFSSLNHNPVVAIIYILAAVATITGTIIALIDRREASETSGASINVPELAETSDVSVSVSEPTDTTEGSTLTRDVDVKISKMMQEIQSVAPQAEAPDERKRTADIKLECNKASMVYGKWHWGCDVKNESDKTIWWRDSFQNEGSRLAWYCFEVGESTCEANTFADKEMSLSAEGSIQFNFINPHESMHFWISCRDERLSCRVSGRAPNLVIEGASFVRGHKG